MNALLLLIYSFITSAHSGGTNSEGCHNNKRSNDYHCHNKRNKPRHIPRKIVLSVYKNEITSSTTYNRKEWPHWIDIDNDCQDTRAEVLIRDSSSAIKFKRDKPCNVSSGEWHDPYTGKVFYKASDIDIDHIVPLAHAHEMGGKYWSREQKRAFANDFENLIAVEDNANQSKNSKPPQEWLPVNKSFHCKYLIKWLFIKSKYQLKASKTEKVYIQNLIMDCK